MEGKLQHQIVFYLTGRREGTALQPLDQTLRPALFARFGDLSSLRYDFPLVLNREGSPDRAVLSLSKMVDEAVNAQGEDLDQDRIARHGYRLEHEIRRELAASGGGDFAARWNAATDLLVAEGDSTVLDSSKRLWKAFAANGEIVDAGVDLPAKAVSHAWNAIQTRQAAAFRVRADRLVLKLRDILAAEIVGSEVGRAPEKLQAAVGSSFAATFDFNAMSRILVDAKPAFELSEERRNRINSLIDVLERQRFYPIESGWPEQYDFAFERCSDALAAYQKRHADAVELVKTLAIADLEAKGEYREAVHDVLFESFGANGLDAGQLAELPDYLVWTDGRSLDPAETAQLVELLAAGLPIKVLVRTDDVLEPSVVAEGHVALGLRARQLVDTAIGLTDVFVFQSSASSLFGKRDSLMRGLSYNGPALFSIFSGANGHTGDVPAYLVAAAAMESRVFPTFVFDPSAGSDWASRLTVNDNPSAENDWPEHEFAYEDEDLQAQAETLAFTLADFMAMDERFFVHYAIVPKEELNDDMIPVPEALKMGGKGVPDQVPCVTLIDGDGRMQRAIFDDRTLLETRRCLSMWHSLQELGGIHNSHAERLLANERKAQAEAPVQAVNETVVAAAAEADAEQTPAAAVESHGDDPYIESSRCTTCNECTQINSKIFAYNDEKQAYIADPDGGTFRQIVEAAEGCQVSIIHPGKPRNLKEPGIEDLIKRAEAFN